MLKPLGCKLLLPLLAPILIGASFPNICDLVNSHSFTENLDFSWEPEVCGEPPRPCARFSYYVPKYFIEVVSHPTQTFFRSLPGVALQLTYTPMGPPFGAEDDEGAYAFHGHTIMVPFTQLAFGGLPCGGGLPDLFCFSMMSERLGMNWRTGKADIKQPAFLAWSLAPKACLVKGAALSVSGSHGMGTGGWSQMCSFNISALPFYPPSPQPICTGWGIHFPRTGVVTSSDQTTASLVIASRVKSLGSEVFNSIYIAGDEKWEMVYPQSSSSFREGQNIAFLLARGVSEWGRLTGKPVNYLYAVWHRTSCRGELFEVPWSQAWLQVLKSSCRGAR